MDAPDSVSTSGDGRIPPRVSSTATSEAYGADPDAGGGRDDSDDAQRGAAATAGSSRQLVVPPQVLQALRGELNSLLRQLHRTPRHTADVRSFLQLHADSLNNIVAAGDESHDLLQMAAYAGHPDIVLTLLDAGAAVPPRLRLDLYSTLLDDADIFDVNGSELDDAGISSRLRVMHQKYGVRVPPSERMSCASSACVERDRPECLRFMIQVDPHARAHVHRLNLEWHAFDVGSLLHLAAGHCMHRCLEVLLTCGWSLEMHDLDCEGLSPLGSCMLTRDFAGAELDHTEAICLAVSILLRDISDAVRVVHASGLCDVTHPDNVHRDTISDYSGAGRGFRMPLLQRTRMHVYVCAAVNATSCVPRRVLASSASSLLRCTPSMLYTLPLDEHVAITSDSTYLPDPLRLGGTTMMRGVWDGAQEEVVPRQALRFAAVVDALCTVERLTRSDRFRWRRCRCMHVLRESAAPIVTGASPTLQNWAWMRRRHALHARKRRLAR